MTQWIGHRLLMLLVFMLSTPVYAINRDLQFIEKLSPESKWVLVDTRANKQCVTRSLKGARCLSTEDILGPNRRFPSLRDIAWLLGTLGLNGDETVIVAGNPGLKRDFVAGVLYLAGQKKVQILTPPLGRLIASSQWEKSVGRARSMSRESIYTVQPRDKQILLRQELWNLIQADRPLRLLDVRSEAEYWGQQIRSFRGGHIPGAEHWNKALGQVNMAVKPAVATVLYAHDPFETISRFIQIQAGAENAVKLFIEGWQAWSIDGSLPADAESFYDMAEQINVIKNN